MRTEIETSDIFKSAFLLCAGANLESTRMNDRKQVIFTLCGEDLDQVELSYRLGQARVEPLRLRDVLNVLRDLIFETLNNSRRSDVQMECGRDQETSQHPGRIPKTRSNPKTSRKRMDRSVFLEGL